MKKTLILTAIFLILTSAWTIAQVVVLQGNGAEFTQVDYPYDIPRLDSETGFLKVDLPDLRLATGMNSGFLNAELNGGWVVRNLPVFTASEYPYLTISTGFNLGSTAGTNVTSFNIDLQFSDNPIDSFVSATPTAFSVGDTTIYTGGMDYDPVTGDGAGAPPAAAAPVDLAKVTADLLNGKSNSKIQFGHPNIETAQSQCAPMAVANSLQFLENTTNLVIPHDHKQGIKGEATPSLVGELGTYMERVVPTTDRRNNAAGGVKTENILKGKLKYLLNNNLSDKVETVYWSGFSSADVSETVGSVTATATYMGKLVSVANMLEYLRNDCDLEAAYYWNYTNAAGALKKGAHAIEITGTGVTKGVPWMIEISDINQKDDSKGAGHNGFVFSHLKDTDNDGMLNLNSGHVELYQIICQCYVGGPVTTVLDTTVTGIDDPSGHICCVDQPPSTISVTKSGSQITFTGTAEWLPMTGVIAPDGAFQATSTGTVAGYSNIHSTFAGTYTDGQIHGGVITVGAGGGLPGGNPIIFTVDLNPPVGTVTEITEDTTISEGQILKINSEDTLVVKAGVTLTINGTLDIDGTLEINSSGSVTNNGIADNDGTIQNSGTITNGTAGQFDNSGQVNNADGSTFNNNGALTNNTSSTIDNDGTINNGANSVTTNAGTIDSSNGTINNLGKINNVFGGTLVNHSPTTIINSGIIVNDSDSTINNETGGTFTNQAVGVIENYGTITNNGTFTNGGIINNYCGAVVNGVIIDNQPINNCSNGLPWIMLLLGD